eukprot:gene27928-32797_t
MELGIDRATEILIDVLARGLGNIGTEVLAQHLRLGTSGGLFGVAPPQSFTIKLMMPGDGHGMLSSHPPSLGSASARPLLQELERSAGQPRGSPQHEPPKGLLGQGAASGLQQQGTQQEPDRPNALDSAAPGDGARAQLAAYRSVSPASIARGGL